MASTISSSHPHNFAGLKCAPSTLICREKTVIMGDVTIAADCIVHPTAHIIARKGPIVIGSNNLIEERASIVNNRSEPMIIGDHNVFEVDSSCQARRVGSNNVLESKSSVGYHIELTDNCIIGAGCRIEPPDEETDESQKVQIFHPNTVISGSDLNRRLVPNLPASSHSSQLDFLRKILQNYNKLWRATNLPETPPAK